MLILALNHPPPPPPPPHTHSHMYCVSVVSGTCATSSTACKTNWYRNGPQMAPSELELLGKMYIVHVPMYNTCIHTCTLCSYYIYMYMYMFSLLQWFLIPTTHLSCPHQSSSLQPPLQLVHNIYTCIYMYIYM